MSASSSVFERATVHAVLRTAGISAGEARRLIQCPLHTEETPSFRVFERGYRCFGCGARGGVADLIVALGFAGDHAEAARWAEDRIP